MINTLSRSEATSHGTVLHSIKSYCDEFSATLAADGYTRLSIGEYVTSIAHFERWLQQRGIPTEEINETAIDHFSNHRCRCFGWYKQSRLSRRYVRRVSRFVSYLRDRGLTRQLPQETSREPIPYIAEYRNWMFRHRGLSARTISRYERHIAQVLPSLGTDTSNYNAAAVRLLILHEAQRTSAATVQSLSNSLRAYLRFLSAEGHCRPGLDEAVPTVPQWRLSSLPRYLPPKEIERVIDCCSPRKSVGIRDRAVLLLLARLGLRAGDIVTMQLDDIDWRAGALRVAGKSRREISLPLPQDAGDALLTYLKLVRPRVAIDRVFLTARAPIRPFQSSVCVSDIVRLALRRAGITHPPSKGANLLRHSAATSMLRAGATLDAVSAVLRHRSLDTTAHYAKVDLRMLEQVVQPWAEGVSC